MPNLLTVYDSEGTIVGRCNAKCYEGTSDRCHCICGGANHGKGLQAAAQNARKLFDIPDSFIPDKKPVGTIKLKHASNLAFLAHPRLFKEPSDVH